MNELPLFDENFGTIVLDKPAVDETTDAELADLIASFNAMHCEIRHTNPLRCTHVPTGRFSTACGKYRYAPACRGQLEYAQACQDKNSNCAECQHPTRECWSIHPLDL